MVAEILSVGTELLLGTTVNTNAAFLSRELAKLGIAVYSQTTVGDNHERLLAAIGRAFETADTVVTTGGLGPTQDDITKVAAAEYFGIGLVMHEESLGRIRARLAGRQVPKIIERDAIVPEGCVVLQNDNGTAPGVFIEKNGKTLILLPGPPHEMEPMFKLYAVPLLREKTDGVFFSRTLKIIGLGESQVELLLKDLVDAQTNPTIAPYAKVGEVHIRLTASAKSDTEAEAIIAPIADEIYKRLAPNIYGEDETTLPQRVLDLVKLGGHSLAVAESCTGGLITSSLVSVPGCSAVLREGLVTYSNHAKTARLQVGETLIKTHGAVSPETAAAMAEGAAKTSGASAGLSVTGIAGPEGGTPEKPIGLVYVGIHIGGATKTVKFNLFGGREEIRTRAAKSALDMLRRELENLDLSRGSDEAQWTK